MKEKSETILRAELDHLQLIIDSLPAFVSYIDIDQQYLFINNAYELWFQKSKSEIIGKSIKDIIGEDSYEISKLYIEKVLQGERCTFQNTITRQSGETRYLEVEYIPDIDINGVTKGIVVLGNDITDRRKFEEQLLFLTDATSILNSELNHEKSLQNLSKLAIEKFSDWCSIELVDEDGEIRTVTVDHKDPEKIKLAAELRERFPQKKDESTSGQVITTRKSFFMPLITEEMIREAIKDEEHLRLLLKVGFTSLMVVPLIAREQVLGTLTLVSSESKKVFTQNDLRMAEELAIRAAIAVDNARLFEESKQAEARIKSLNEELEKRVEERTKELISTNEELERSNNELQDFAYVASHDLQEPLRKITAFSDLLERNSEKELSEQSKQYMQIIKKASRRMSTLINDLLTYSRVTTKINPPTTIDLNTLVDEVLDDVQQRIKTSNASIEVGNLGIIEGDPLQFRILFQNLISNALKYKKEDIDTQIEIERKDFKETINFYVKDNGIGFDETYINKIFTIFQRLHSKDEYEGTGIGLAICKKIAERHGGMIEAKSELGVGSTFIIKFTKN